MKVKKMYHKPSGIWFWLSAKLAWGKPYYSADGDKTWHSSKTAAFQTALQQGTLEVTK